MPILIGSGSSDSGTGVRPVSHAQDARATLARGQYRERPGSTRVTESWSPNKHPVAIAPGTDSIPIPNTLFSCAIISSLSDHFRGDFTVRRSKLLFCSLIIVIG